MNLCLSTCLSSLASSATKLQRKFYGDRMDISYLFKNTHIIIDSRLIFELCSEFNFSHIKSMQKCTLFIPLLKAIGQYGLGG